MKKALEQTVRDLKREVNKKVLKVPSIEQKVLDVTSNDPWGPHGTYLAELANATHNVHACQLIMAVIWKRINDTGKNWRHVFKALAVLEYLIGHGSERVIDEIREHAYQISTLSAFQYIDSGGKDQGINVRRKSQILVALVNDRERLKEVRQKAQVNKDKFGTASTGGAYRQSAYSGSGGYAQYDDGNHHGSRGVRQNGCGSAYRDDNYRGRANDAKQQLRPRSQSVGGYNEKQLRPRSQSVDGFADHCFGDCNHYLSRDGGKADDQSHSQDERGLEDNLGGNYETAPPSYEEATKDSQENIQDERDGETVAASRQNLSSPPTLKPTSPSVQGAENAVACEVVSSQSNIYQRGSAVQPALSSPGLDILGLSASDSYPSPLVPASPTTCQTDTATDSVFGSDFLTAPSSALPASNQPNENPFGDAPFKVITQEVIHGQTKHLPHVAIDQLSGSISVSETLPTTPQNAEALPTFDFEDALRGLTYASPTVDGQHALVQSNNDILDAILPRTGSCPVISSQEAQPAEQTAPMVRHGSPTNIQIDQINPFGPLLSTLVVSQEPTTNPQTAQTNSSQSSGPSTSGASRGLRTNVHFFQPSQMDVQNACVNFFQQSGLPTSEVSQGLHPNMQADQWNSLQPLTLSALQGSQTNTQTTQTNFLQYSDQPAPLPSQSATTSSSSTAKPQQKFETKSSVWADTLSRGIVNLDISGPKTNPLADIGVDFDAINRKDKRLEPKSSAASTIIMGKAMGSGSGIGRAAAGGLAPPRNPMMGTGGYCGNVNRPPVGMNMGGGMNRGMGQGAPIQPQGPGLHGDGYNPMAGMGGYGSRYPYGGGYRQREI